MTEKDSNQAKIYLLLVSLILNFCAIIRRIGVLVGIVLLAFSHTQSSSSKLILRTVIILNNKRFVCIGFANARVSKV